ncbi:hypothetical protein CN692_07230 [Bacillus sp. AFS002410]|uniref:DUF2750 domain-containing protein n=1 Tax=Bacillus sp. AFS002410 TaxID=2033481 RepID=UPI000BEF79F6|nr:DUF2750 domain-containing protein [Bacillus sp. AFS002410]PEJ59264.1 hypothetical protein CN692_07230 [Bacillus sp. AFS002410]
MKNIQSPRTGLRVRCEKGVEPSVRQSCLDFAAWLRLKMKFPIRVVVYLKKAYQIKAIDKEMVSATFFGPYDKNVEPFIRVATGDYEELVLEIGEENAIYAILNCMAHEIIHYLQWLKDPNFDVEMAEVEADSGSIKLVDEFYGYDFINEIIERQKVWTIQNNEGIPTTSSDREESMPFWSSKLRTENVIKSVPVYHDYQVLEMSFETFKNVWLPRLDKDGLYIAANLSGESLVGNDWRPEELLEQIQFKLDDD